MTTIKLPICAIVLIVVGLVAAGYFSSMWYERMRAKRNVTESNGSSEASPLVAVTNDEIPESAVA